MDLSTKITILLAVVYNLMLANILVLATFNPYVITLFIAIDFVLIFYYLFYVTVDGIKTRKFKRSHEDLISKAQKEVSEAR